MRSRFVFRTFPGGHGAGGGVRPVWSTVRHLRRGVCWFLVRWVDPSVPVHLPLGRVFGTRLFSGVRVSDLVLWVLTRNTPVRDYTLGFSHFRAQIFTHVLLWPVK